MLIADQLVSFPDCDYLEVQSEKDASINGKYFESDINSEKDMPVFRHLVEDRLVYWFQDRWAIGAKSNMESGETPILQSKVSIGKSEAWEMTWDEAVVSCGKESGKRELKVTKPYSRV